MIPETGIGRRKGVFYESRYPQQSPKLDPQFSGIGRQREGGGGGKTFGIPRRRRPADNSNEGGQ